MKKYELSNYITHKYAEIHTDISPNGFVYVLYYNKGELDDNVKGTGSDHCNGERRFKSETAALNSARRYITKAEKEIDLCEIMCK